MAREVQIITWCDFCLAEDLQTEATERAGLNSAGARVVVDLCDDHTESHLAPALDVFDTYGRVEAKQRAHTKSQSQNSDRKTTPAPGPCPECGKEFATTQSLGMHRWRKHGVPSATRHRDKKVAA